MIDWAAVETLRSEIGAEDFAEVVAAFLEETDEVISRLDSAPNPESLRSDFHFLKGSALNLGFRVFAEFCRASEALAASGRGGEIDLKTAISAYESSKSEFLSTLG